MDKRRLNPHRGGKATKLYFRASDSDHTLLSRMAQDEGTSRSVVLRRLLREAAKKEIRK